MAPPIIVDLQNTCETIAHPSQADFQRWVALVLNNKMPDAELTIRLVSSDDISQLNKTYRNKTGPTNVLAFPVELPKGVNLEIPLLGDIIICSEIIIQQAKEQEKPLAAHWAHIVIHATLHLLGYDHNNPSDAATMETLEIDYLKQLDFANPYTLED